jgi:hypothetical protein
MRTVLFTLVFLSIPLVSIGDGSIHITLEGRWSGDAPDGTKITYEFNKDGSVTWFVEEENFKKMAPLGLPGKYKIRVAEPHWEMDITDFADPRFKQFKFMAIIKIIDARTFRMEGDRPGTRPKEFGKDAINFRAEAKP